MPDERARSLRWGWEFLWELQSAENLRPEHLEKVKVVLRHYPSTSEIAVWARELNGDWLEEEDYNLSGPQSGIPLRVDRGPTTPLERHQSLVDASMLFHVDLRMAGNLTAEQKHSLLYVRRHFPEQWELRDPVAPN